MGTDVIILATAVVGFMTTLVIGFVTVWKEIRGVHKVINSRMDELLELTRKLAYIAGLKQGREEEREG